MLVYYTLSLCVQVLENSVNSGKGNSKSECYFSAKKGSSVNNAHFAENLSKVTGLPKKKDLFLWKFAFVKTFAYRACSSVSSIICS